jgi:hypothetical protein
MADESVFTDIILTAVGTSPLSTVLAGMASGDIMTVHNATGSTLSKGDIVSLVGVHTTGVAKAVKADANAANLKAMGAVQADILNGATGTIIMTGLSPATLNTDAFSAIDDPVYLSETAGAVATSEETEADETSQIIGYVNVKSATVGQIYYTMDKVKSIGSNELKDGSVLRDKIAADAVNGTKLADDAVDSEHIAAGAIDPEHFAALSVETAAIAADAVTNAKLGPQVKKSYKFSYVFATQGGAQGALTLTAANGQLPDNFVITNAWVESTVALSSGGAATCALGITGNTDLFNDDNFDAGPYTGSDLITAVADELPVKLAAATDVLLTVGTADLTTAGTFHLWVEGYEGA